MKVTFTLNGRETSLEILAGETLLDTLRAAGLFSVKLIF